MPTNQRHLWNIHDEAFLRVPALFVEKELAFWTFPGSRSCDVQRWSYCEASRTGRAADARMGFWFSLGTWNSDRALSSCKEQGAGPTWRGLTASSTELQSYSRDKRICRDFWTASCSTWNQLKENPNLDGEETFWESLDARKSTNSGS